MSGPAPVFSANLGFLYTDMALADRIVAAAEDGFDAVEMHDPFDVEATEIASRLRQTGLKCLSINTRRGDATKGMVGLAAIAGHQHEAQDMIDEAITYAAAIDCPHVHVLSGRIAAGSRDDALVVLTENLRYAARKAAGQGITILVEPINDRDVPGYAITRPAEAAAVIAAVGEPNIAMMFDLYHVQIMGGDPLHRFTLHRDIIAHVQFSAVPSRDEPDCGEVDLAWTLGALRDLGYRGAFGAEYQPRNGTKKSLGWLPRFRQSLRGSG